jgi:hypothetical protein
MNSNPRNEQAKADTVPKSRQPRRLARLVLTVILSLGFGDAVLAGAGWTDYVGVAELIPTSKHYYELRLPVSENPSGCREDHWFYQNYESLGSEQMFEVLLESVKSGLPVRIYVTGNCNLQGYAEFSSVGIAR